MAAPTTALAAAVDPQSYTSGSIETMKTLVTAALPSCLSTELNEIKQIMHAIARGPYLAPTRRFQPHIHERPLDNNHVMYLLDILGDADLRMTHPAYIFIPDEQWSAASCSYDNPPQQPNDCQVWVPPPPPSPQPLYLTHGHRFAALRVAMRRDTDQACQAAFTQIYRID